MTNCDCRCWIVTIFLDISTLCMQVEPYELGPDLLAAQKLPSKAVHSGMALEGESGPDPAKFDIMNADDFGIWQNRTMKHSDTALAEQSTIPGYASLLAAEAIPLAPPSLQCQC